uniref:hypothetical protein n=1 Tax=Pedobacter sp. SYP-B3415 TaxID=2496641 RepID=UPI00197E83B6
VRIIKPIGIQLRGNNQRDRSFDISQSYKKLTALFGIDYAVQRTKKRKVETLIYLRLFLLMVDLKEYY